MGEVDVTISKTKFSLFFPEKGQLKKGMPGMRPLEPDSTLESRVGPQVNSMIRGTMLKDNSTN
jgi:hypothetical protein